MKSSARFIILLLLFFVSFLFLSSSKIFAQTPSPNDGTPKPWEQFFPTLDQMESTELDIRRDDTFKNVGLYGFRAKAYDEASFFGNTIHFIAGWQTAEAQKSSYLNDYEKKGAIGVLAQAVGTMYANPPASGIAYTHDFLANAGFIAKPAYAQGIGFAGLVPLLPLWKASRNIAYAILIIVMIVIGFMIIFRAKIDPKTVISVQAALPRIVFTLIMITLSYAIVGFFIDLMYLSMAVVINLLSTGLSGITLIPGTEMLTNTAQQQTEFITGGWGKLWGSIFSLNMFWPFIVQMLGGSWGNIAGLTIFSVIGMIVAGVIGASATLYALLPSLAIILLVVLGLLFTVIRLTFILFNSYVQVLLAVILGPLLLLKEAIPGQSAVKEWIQNIIANLVVFPTTVAVIYGSWIFTAIAWEGNLWSAPLSFGTGGGTENGNPFAILMGLGIIFLAPNLVASVKKAFHPKPVLPVTAGTAFSPVTGAAQTGMGAMSQYYYMTQVFGGEKGLGPILSKFGLGGGGSHGKKQSA